MIVGLETSDDAGVYQLNEEIALVQTVDFFTPVVDDPYVFGQIAASNALSDIYAKGGQPITCMNLVGFPVGQLDYQVLKDILAGGYERVEAASASLVGGHSIEDQEPKYGLSVTGLVHPEKVWKNSGAKPGDRLILTKPLGVGIITTAIKGGVAQTSHMEQAVSTMVELNRVAKECLASFSVSACTDITGFGLLGHANELASGSQVDLEIWNDQVPVLTGTKSYAQEGIVPGGTRKNLAYFGEVCAFDEELSEDDKLILADAITSGGLLVSLPESEVDDAVARLKESGTLAYSEIGRVLERSHEHRSTIHVRKTPNS